MAYELYQSRHKGYEIDNLLDDVVDLNADVAALKTEYDANKVKMSDGTILPLHLVNTYATKTELNAKADSTQVAADIATATTDMATQTQVASDIATATTDMATNASVASAIAAAAYTLPEATISTLGGVKPDGTTITVDNDGTIHGAQSLPTGGMSGQVLKKKSATDYDVEWADESGGGASIQKAEMPVPTSTLLDSIVEYVGETDENFTNGYFYKCKAHIVDTTIPDFYPPIYTPEQSFWSLEYSYDIDYDIDLYYYQCTIYIDGVEAGGSQGGGENQHWTGHLPAGSVLQFYGGNSRYVKDINLHHEDYYWEQVDVQPANEDVETISKADFDALPQSEKDNGKAYFIPDVDLLSGFTVMGNRFDKANIYTADERMIGSYMGKPLYQKTFELSTGVNISANTWINVDASLSGAERIILCNGYNNNGVISLYANPRSGANGFVIYSAIALNDVTKFTVQYTKTTDGVVNIGTGNDYSTDEQIIGTWIDGKKLYQKTVHFTSLNATWAEVAHNIVNINQVCNINGVVGDNTAMFTTGGCVSNEYERVFFQITATHVKCYVAGNNSLVNKPVYVTIQYTKTED